MSDEPIKTLVEGPGGWLWSVDDDDAVYSGVCATEHEARAAMDDTVRGDELVQVRAELKQVRADALLLAVLWNGTNRNSRWFHLADDAVGDLSDAERSTLAELWDNLEATNDDLVALLRRALGERHET